MSPTHQNLTGYTHTSTDQQQPQMTAVHPYILYLADVACQRPLASPAPAVHLPDGSDPAAFVMNVLRYVGTTTLSRDDSPACGHKPLPITRHGTNDMIDLLFQNPLFWSTLPHAAHIQEHFATTFLRTTNAVFQDHWTYVIVPAWNQMAELHEMCKHSSATDVNAYQIAQTTHIPQMAAGAGSAAAGAT
jgi:hypothetical protein